MLTNQGVQFPVLVILNVRGFVGTELLQASTSLTDSGVWLKISTYTVESALVVSALILGASMGHGHDSNSMLHYILLSLSALLKFLTQLHYVMQFHAFVATSISHPSRWAFYFYKSNSPW